MSSEHGKAPLAHRDFIAVGAASLGGLAACHAAAAAAATPSVSRAHDLRSAVNDLVCDVFGTVVAGLEIWPPSSVSSAEFRSKKLS